MNNFKFSDDLKEAIQYGLCIFCILGAMVMSFIAMYLVPQGIIDSSILWLIAQVLVFCGALIGINSSHNVQMKKINGKISSIESKNTVVGNEGDK